MTGPADAQQSWTSLTTHELFFLLSLGDGPLNELSRRRLGIGTAVADSADMQLAGASTLLVRGLAKLGEAAVEPIEACAVVSWALSTAHTWWEVGVTAGENADALLVLTNDDVAVVFAPATLGIFQFALVDPGAAAAEAARAFTFSVLDSQSEVAVAARRVEVDAEESLGVLRDGARWRVARPLLERDDPAFTPPTDCSAARARQLIEDVLR